LIFETVTPVGVFSQKLHSIVEAALEEVLGHLKALEFVHSLHLLLTFGSSNVKLFVLLLDAAHFTLHLLNPVFVGLLLALRVLAFEFADFFQFGFFLDLKKSLLHRFSEQDIENRLDFSVIVKKVVVFNLSDLINTCLLGDIPR
jgi:hypothetical protein